MDNTKIDYNTANIIIPINTPNGEIKVFLPPSNKDEIKSNALILGRFAEYTDKIAVPVLLADYDIYIDEAIEKIVDEKYNINDPRYKEYSEDSKLKIAAMLERSIAAGYYFENNEVKSLSGIDSEAKELIKASLLFFIVILRYMKPRLKTEEWEERIEKVGITFTSSNATEWKNTFMTQSQTQETFEA